MKAKAFSRAVLIKVPDIAGSNKFGPGNIYILKHIIPLSIKKDLTKKSRKL